MSTASATPTTASGNPYVDGLQADNQWTDDDPGASTTLAYYVVGDDGVTEDFLYGLDDVTGLTSEAEEEAFLAALDLYESVSNLEFVEVDSQAEADILLGAGPAPGFEGALGFATTPGGEATGVKINSDNLATGDGSSLLPGGYDFITVLHEVGHALGLKHSFSDERFAPFPGVSEPGDLGDNGLNQGVYTVMGYNDGFPERDGPGDTGVNEGWSATLMAFDVAAIQQMYGANMTYAVGDDAYALPDGVGDAAYACIWDAGGIDVIEVEGDGDATIDLRAATLRNAPGGGGYLSSQEGVKGGFTIANGVVIENATGGGGDDVLTGNRAANTLEGGAGDDQLRGLGGADELQGGTDDDLLVGGAGGDVLLGGAGADVFVFSRVAASSFANPDTIVGWDALDRIDLSGFDDVVAGGLTLVDRADATGAVGEVWVEQNFGVTQVFGILDEEPGIDLAIVIDDLVTLTAESFVL